MTTHTKDPEEIAALEYLRARAAKENMRGLVLCVSSETIPDPFHARAPEPGNGDVNAYGFGASIGDAIADLRSKLPSEREAAEKLRRRAEAMHAQAAILDPQD